MKRQLIREIYASPEAFGGKSVTLGGWVRNLRDSKAFGFILTTALISRAFR